MNEEKITYLCQQPPRMRTAAGAMEIIKAADPETEVTLRYIRGLINTGKVHHVQVGRKKLVDVDKLITYLSNGQTEGVGV